MRVENLTSNRGNTIPNQFEITDDLGNIFFQSYNSIIVKICVTGETLLDSHYWNYSVTTGKYRNIFLGEDRKETEGKIKSGEYILTNLN